MLRFRLFGMEVRIDFLFVALITIFLLTDKSGISVIGLSTCIIHELSHVVAFYIVGFTPTLLAFESTGIRLQKPALLLPRGKEMLVIIAGSGINLLLFLIIWITQIINNSNVDYSIAIQALSHLSVGIYNLLPLHGLDGGKLLSLFLTALLRDETAHKISAWIDISVLSCLLLLCLLVLIQTGGSFTLLIFLSYLLTTVVTRIKPK